MIFAFLSNCKCFVHLFVFSNFFLSFAPTGQRVQSGTCLELRLTEAAFTRLLKG